LRIQLADSSGRDKYRRTFSTVAMSWSQVYDPLGNVLLSTAFAALPIVVLLGSLGVLRIRAHYAAVLGLTTSFIVAVVVFRMPVAMTVGSAVYGPRTVCFPSVGLSSM